MKYDNKKQIKDYVTKKGQKRYYFKIYLGKDPFTGKPKYTTRRFKTYQEAKRELVRMQYEKEKGKYNQILPNTKSVTYEDVYHLWIEHYEKTVEESTYTKTVGLFERHILPVLGQFKINKMNYQICQNSVNEWGMKFKKGKMMKSYASKVMDYAIKLGYIEQNPFSMIEMPKQKNEKNFEELKNFYTKEQLIEFLTCLKKEGDQKKFTLFYLLSYTGLRKGEALALTWKDINFHTQEILINKAIAKGKNHQIYIKEPKSGLPRNLSIGSEVTTVLKNWKEEQRKQLEMLGLFPLSDEQQLVFSNTKNSYIQPSKTSDWLKKLIIKYELPPITTHGLRHTHCSLLIEAGVGIKEIQERLGHADIKTTLNIYAHLSKKARDQTAEKFEVFMNM